MSYTIEGMAELNESVLEDEDFDTILSANIEFSGTLIFEKPFLIRGRVQGFIKSKGLLLIDEGAVVNADIESARVIIRGQVTGNIMASEKVEVVASAVIIGDVFSPNVFMASGCSFNGRCIMTNSDQSRGTATI